MVDVMVVEVQAVVEVHRAALAAKFHSAQVQIPNGMDSDPSQDKTQHQVFLV
jgi:hypothetical protein